MRLDKSGLIVTFLCNLRCKHCVGYAPYYDDPKVFTLDSLKETTDRLFALDLTVGKFSFSGGEPFLFDKLDELVDYVGSSYGNRIEVMEVVTNGTIMITDSLVDVLKKHSPLSEVLIDDYTVSGVAEDISKRLKEANVRHRVRDYKNDLYLGGWIDLTDFSLKHTPDEAKAIFKKCAFGGNSEAFHYSTSITDGKIYKCHFERRADELGIAKLQKNNYLDLYDDTESPEEKVRKVTDLMNEFAPDACRYCNGFCKDRTDRQIPAIQLED
jgi:sulfatase maturation enzyme AslB (radical SAM superfamily)